MRQEVNTAVMPHLRVTAKAIILSELTRLAKNETVRYYDEFLQRVNCKLAEVPGVHYVQFENAHLNFPGSFTEILGEVSTLMYNEGLGLLSSVVIGREHQRPGAGYFMLCRQLGMNFKNAEDSRDSIWSQNLNEVFNIWRVTK